MSENFYQLFTDLDLNNTHLGFVGQKDFISPPTEKKGQDIIQNVTHDESARLLGGLAGNAGVFASILDLVKFGQAWIDGKIVDQRFWTNMFIKITIKQTKVRKLWAGG